MDNKIIRSKIQISNEKLGLGPRGYRIHVVDYDASQRVLYKPADLGKNLSDRFTTVNDSELLENPEFHAQNAYAVAMRILECFEFALGRRISWGFGGHQIYLSPHAFAEANAYYSASDHGLFFGYFQDQSGKIIYTCLSHDVVAHETCHALLDGLRDCYNFPSSPDQAGFHEGFADMVAILSVFELTDVLKNLLPEKKIGSNQITFADIQEDTLRQSVLMGIGKQLGESISDFGGRALRNAAARKPDRHAMTTTKFEECHLRGEILSAAVLSTFIKIWIRRMEDWRPEYFQSETKNRDELMNKKLPLDRVIEDGSDAAKHLLTMVIRALDYCPVVDITFSDFLSGLITADYELLPDDGKYGYRKALLEEFEFWGILPASNASPWKSNKNRLNDRGKIPAIGTWEKPNKIDELSNTGIHRESLESNPEEVFKYIWNNREPLGIYEDVYMEVISVRPCHRIGPDGFYIRETVSEYLQIMDLVAEQLEDFKISKPKDMPDDTKIRMYGGGVLVFDEFGDLKYHVRSRVDNTARQSKRLNYLWENGIVDSDGRYGLKDGSPPGQEFAMMHLRRVEQSERKEEWNE